MLTDVLGRDYPLAHGIAPAWADVWGQDQFGIWATVTVAEVNQRFRWISGGRATLGSPKDEVGRFDNEESRECDLAPFWLADTPCTQSLWRGVELENPSHFDGDCRPVESVSFDQVQEMLGRLNDRVPGLEARLPTEDEWEFACRSEVAHATYRGDLLESPNEDRAPGLDSIAWHGANSNETTHVVGQKLPNGFGLYDMLGNVFEWCSTEVDAIRVRRGGSWSSFPRFVRAAARYWSHPSRRLGHLGFRLARGRKPGAEPSESAR